jgi:3-oxoacyl-[acyl-carrier-protein] synthase-3
MPKSVFRGIRIVGVAGAVPRQVVNNLTDHDFCPEDERRKIVALTKVRSYRMAPAHLCASDLCHEAAVSLLGALQVRASDIDAVVFATMTPDYRVPSTACVLQHRLNVGASAVAYDINMGCSGFVVGLYNSCALIQGAGLRRVLLLTGDTQTKLCHRTDKNVVFILGDGGTATLIEAAADAPDVVIELFTDGSRFRSLYVPAGGFRTPSSAATREVREQADGGMRSDDNLYMNGMEIFKFSSSDVVRAIGGFMAAEGLQPSDVDSLFLHQANGFMNEKISRKLGFADDHVPQTIEFYGNTGSASIPLTIAHHVSSRGSRAGGRCLMSGFGVGLSWGVAAATLDGVYSPPVVEVD